MRAAFDSKAVLFFCLVTFWLGKHTAHHYKYGQLLKNISLLSRFMWLLLKIIVHFASIAMVTSLKWASLFDFGLAQLWFFWLFVHLFLDHIIGCHVSHHCARVSLICFFWEEVTQPNLIKRQASFPTFSSNIIIYLVACWWLIVNRQL